MSKNSKKRLGWLALLPVSFVMIIVVVYFGYLKGQQEIQENTSTAQTEKSDEILQIEREIKSYEEVWRTHPMHPPIALKLAQLYSEKKDHTKSIEYFRIFMQIDTTIDKNALKVDLSKEYFMRGDTDSAKTILFSVLEVDSLHEGAMYNLGAIEANQGNTDKAIEIWEKQLNHHPRSIMAHMAINGIEKLKNQNSDDH